MVTDKQILDTIIHHEGSAFTNDPADAGGPTRWGITIHTLSSWYGRPATIDEVRELDRETAEAIYRSIYIKPFSGLVEPLRINVIDMGVNAGVRKATMLLQQMVGATVDSWIGPETLKLAKAMATIEPANEIYTGFRLAYYEDLIVAVPSNRKWRNGWRRRALSFTEPLPKHIAPPSAQQSLIMAKAA